MVFQLFSNYLELFCCVKSLWEDHISTCVDKTLWSLDAFLQSVHSFSVSSGTNDKFAIWDFYACLSCDSNLINHLIGRNELFSIQVTTSFWENLIFNMKSTCSTVEKVSDSSGTHLSFTESSISISNDWQIGESWDIFNNFAELIQSSESNVWDTRWGSKSSTRNVECSESMLSCQSGNKSIVTSRNHETFSGEKFSELFAPINELH